MIARLWSARTREPQSAAYLEHFDSYVVPKLRECNGYIGATVLTRKADSTVEILVVTLWRSLDAIKAFAGSDVEASVVAEEASVLLTEYDQRVRHFDVRKADTLEYSPMSPLAFR